MCGQIEQADRLKCFPSLDDLPIQEALSISRIIGILYRFRDILPDRTTEVIRNANELLKQHISGYSKAEHGSSIYEQNTSIREICSYAAALLNRGGYDAIQYKGKIIDWGYRFQNECLSNMGLLIPLESGVIEILPFLLLCYSANAPYNKLDPFMYLGGDKVGNEVTGIAAGWLRIFQDLQARYAYGTEPTDGNQKRDIRQLAKYCTRWPSKLSVPNYSSLLDLKGVVSGGICSISRITDKGEAFRKERAKSVRVIKDWELYRKFAAFCDACNTYGRRFKERTFNLTLSMALFAQFWKFDIDVEAYPDDQEFIQPITWEAVEADRLHDEIVDATQLREDEGCGSIDIHGIVREKILWFLKFYGTESSDRPIFYSQAADLDSDTLQ